MTTDLAQLKQEEGVPALLERTPKEVIAQATEWAEALMDIVEKRQLFSTMDNKKYLHIEAWQTIGFFAQVSPNLVENPTSILNEQGEIIGYNAFVELISDKTGRRVSSASMPCYFSDYPCQGKMVDQKHKAAKSAAQTWALSKAYRMKYSVVAVLAGFEPTPAEEMTGSSEDPDPSGQDAPMGYCSGHKKAFVHRTGTAKTGPNKGKPYDFWACSEKIEGEYCRQTPEVWIQSELKKLGFSNQVQVAYRMGYSTWKAYAAGKTYKDIVQEVSDVVQAEQEPSAPENSE